jgi:hypothetical protein
VRAYCLSSPEKTGNLNSVKTVEPTQQPQARYNSASVQMYQEHIAREGNGQVNENLDGCFFCGSQWHHSQECPERDEPLREEIS